MSLMSKLFVCAAVCLPRLCLADDWSSCQTITSVVNWTAYTPQIVVNLSPGIPACAPTAAGPIVFKVGQMGVTDELLKGYLATALAAYLSGKQVMIYYNNSCAANILAVGGYYGQCN